MTEVQDVVETIHHPLRLRRLEVLAIARPTPRVVRVTLGGPELEGFCHGAPDDHVKVFFPSVDTGELVLPEVGGRGVVWPTEGPRPVARDYTPTWAELEAGRFCIDIVLHEGGDAATWARSASPGVTLGVAGPRGSHVLRRTFGSYLLVGDETALPAIREWLRQVPVRTAAYAYIEVADASDHQALASDGRAMVRWLHRRGAEPGTTSLLADAVAQHGASLDDTYVWVAAEASAVQKIRRHLLDERNLDSTFLSARGYWKLGAEDHQEPHDD